MTDGPGPYEPPVPPPGWAAQQPPPYGTPAHWAAPGQQPPPPPAPPGQYYGYNPYNPYGNPYGGMKPGIIPLRPLQLGDMYNGAVQAIRSNPRATLGLAAAVVTISELVALAIQLPLLQPLLGRLTDPSFIQQGNAEDLIAPLFGFLGGTLLGAVLSVIATVVLTGMLTSVVGRAVFGESITIGEAWRQTRSRVLPLLGLGLLQTLMMLAVILIPVVLIAVLAASTSGPAVVLVGFLLTVGAAITAIFLYVKMSLAGPAVVLERIGVFAAIGRSFRLVSGDFFRVFGILLLTAVIVFFISLAVSAPFSVFSSFGSTTPDSLDGGFVMSMVLGTLGAIIAGTITSPFSAAVNALLYADRRMRAEAFDLVLQTEAVERQRGGQPTGPLDLWHPAYGSGAPRGYQQPPQYGSPGYEPPPPGPWQQ
ncbi:hypothetical protein [Acrocarpospora catenulata]|uniref:hypothetical protein n=1 Tax=Acrocarpospora catenulata TaxID=2836182 RepID=UPI001BDA9F51|nr:hypothetical protein [Acrocarpospora catenulata]